MQNKDNVSATYLRAIADERIVLNYEIASGETDIAGLATSMLETINRNLAQGFSGEMRDYFLGSRDFWANQLKKYNN